MPRGDEFSRMADEVQEDMQTPGVDFLTAFKNAAHRRRCYYRLDRNRYNYMCSVVERRVKRRKSKTPDFPRTPTPVLTLVPSSSPAKSSGPEFWPSFVHTFDDYLWEGGAPGSTPLG